MSRASTGRMVEWITNLAVVASLAVLVVEVRANTTAIERDMLQERSAKIYEPFLSGPDLMEALERIKAVDGWDAQNEAFMRRYGLEPRQAIAWTRHLMSLWYSLETDFVTNGPSESLANLIRGAAEFPDQRLFLETERFSPGFREYVRALTESP